jgi:dephospho-CoA kinase
MGEVQERVAVLLMGPMRAGKTTAASILQDKYGLVKVSLAGSLKSLYSAVNGGALDKDREWLQKHGSAHRQVFGEDFWAEMLIREIQNNHYRSFVVDDIRYENEFELLYEFAQRNCDVVMPVFVKASLENQIIRGAEPQLMMHHSEKMCQSMSNKILTDYEGLETTNLRGVSIGVLDGNLPLLDYLKDVANIIPFPVLYDKKRDIYS